MQSIPGRIPLILLTLVLSSLQSLTRAGASDVLDAANAVRMRGCEDHDGVNRALSLSAKLSDAARRWSRGGSLSDALSRTGYRARQSASIRISGLQPGQALSPMLAARFCQRLTDPGLREIGFAQRRDQLWLIIANPFSDEQLASETEVAHRVLQLVNQARSRSRSCGGKNLGAAQPLSLNDALTRAARAHSKDMASRGDLSHTGGDGSTPAKRATRVGYRWIVVAENVAAGPESPEEVVRGWLGSPGHCTNIMDARFTEMGLGYTVDWRSRGGIYWAQVFALGR